MKAEPLIDLRPSVANRVSVRASGSAWNWALAYSTEAVVCRSEGNTSIGSEPALDMIKMFDQENGATPDQLALALRAIELGRPVAFLGWWPPPGALLTQRVLGLDVVAMPAWNRHELVEGHAVCLVGYLADDALPGGGCLIVRDPWRHPVGMCSGVDRYVPFAYVRHFATALACFVECAPSDHFRARGIRAMQRSASTAQIIQARARCADPSGLLTQLFFSDDLVTWLGRSRSVPGAPGPTSVSGARFDGRALRRVGRSAARRRRDHASQTRRGRPSKGADRYLHVDEITGEPVVA